MNWKAVARRELSEDRALCGHCLKRVALTKTRTQLGARFMRRHNIGGRSSPECAGSGVPEKMTVLRRRR